MNTLSDRDIFYSQPLKVPEYTYKPLNLINNLGAYPFSYNLLSRAASLSLPQNSHAVSLSHLFLIQNLIDARLKESQSGLPNLKFINEPITSYAKNMVAEAEVKTGMNDGKVHVDDKTKVVGFKRYNKPSLESQENSSASVHSKSLTLEKPSLLDGLSIETLCQAQNPKISEQISLDILDSTSESSGTTTSSKSDPKSSQKHLKESMNPQARRLKKMKEIKVKKDEQKKKEKFFQTKSEIIGMVSKEIQSSLGLSDVCQEKLYNLLTKNEMDPSKAMMRVKVNPIYYKKYFQS